MLRHHGCGGAEGFFGLAGAAELFGGGDHGERYQLAVGGEDTDALEGKGGVERISEHGEQFAAVEKSLVGVRRFRIAHDEAQIGLCRPLIGCDRFKVFRSIEESLGGARTGWPGIGEFFELLRSEIVELLVRQLRGEAEILLLLEQPLLRGQEAAEQDQNEQSKGQFM